MFFKFLFRTSMEREQDRIQKDGERKCDMDGAQREFFVGEEEKEGKRERK